MQEAGDPWAPLKAMAEKKASNKLAYYGEYDPVLGE